METTQYMREQKPEILRNHSVANLCNIKNNRKTITVNKFDDTIGSCTRVCLCLMRLNIYIPNPNMKWLVHFGGLHAALDIEMVFCILTITVTVTAMIIWNMSHHDLQKKWHKKYPRNGAYFVRHWHIHIYIYIYWHMVSRHSTCIFIEQSCMRKLYFHVQCVWCFWCYCMEHKTTLLLFWWKIIRFYKHNVGLHENSTFVSRGS